jgi:hypothetical protein
MKWKGFGRKRSWPNFKILFWNSSGRFEEDYENSLDSRSPAGELKPGPPEYEANTILCNVSAITYVIFFDLHTFRTIRVNYYYYYYYFILFYP